LFLEKIQASQLINNLRVPENVFVKRAVSSFRLLTHAAGNRFYNMALDEALLRSVKAPVLRFYRWTEPDALSIGYFDKHTDVPDHRPFVRRYTGGGLVDHQADFTYSIVLPKSHPLALLGTSGSYQSIHEAVTQALLQQGFEASLAPCCLEALSHACFQKPVKFDVVAGTSKLAGAAQRRTREGCLHQGSILVKQFDDESLRKSMIQFISPLLAEKAVEDNLTGQEKDLAQRLESERYSQNDWNFSR
jgi:lipoyl(octanoyl) transferase